MSDRPDPQVYSIAAHRGFADALVAGLVPRYSEDEFGLARLTLLLPSQRAVRTVTEAFIRHYGAQGGKAGMLMPRMAAIGDLDLDEALGPLFDPLMTDREIPPAVDVTRRWLRLAEIIREVRAEKAPKGSALLRLADEIARAMDRLLVEDVGPEELVQPRVLNLLPDVSEQWLKGIETFIKVQDAWLAELGRTGFVDPADRRNRLFRAMRRKWTANPPQSAIIAAGVTSAAPALAKLLRTVADLPRGAVILPDLDLSMDDAVWDELGVAGAPANADDPPFGRGDAVTHPQYHLKLLLNRMGVTRGEVQPWHRAGMAKGPPERSHAISSVFLPPQASKTWATLPAEARRLADSNQAKRPADTVDQQIASNNAQISALQSVKAQEMGRMSAAQSAQARAPLVQEQIAQQQQKLEGLNTQYESVSTRLLAAQASAKAESEQKGERLSVIDPPVVPEDPNSPNRPLLIAGGLAFGLGFGLFLILLVELYYRPIRDMLDIRSVTGEMPLVSIPTIDPAASAPKTRLQRLLAFLPRRGRVLHRANS